MKYIEFLSSSILSFYFNTNLNKFKSEFQLMTKNTCDRIFINKKKYNLFINIF
jgi:hypothetical protein